MIEGEGVGEYRESLDRTAELMPVKEGLVEGGQEKKVSTPQQSFRKESASKICSLQANITY